MNGRASTRAASGIGLLPIVGQPVGGEWDLALPDDPAMENRPRTLLSEERITDLLLVITFAGEEIPWRQQ